MDQDISAESACVGLGRTDACGQCDDVRRASGHVLGLSTGSVSEYERKGQGQIGFERVCINIGNLVAHLRAPRQNGSVEENSRTFYNSNRLNIEMLRRRSRRVQLVLLLNYY